MLYTDIPSWRDGSQYKINPMMAVGHQVHQKPASHLLVRVCVWTGALCKQAKQRVESILGGQRLEFHPELVQRVLSRAELLAKVGRIDGVRQFILQGRTTTFTRRARWT